MAVRGREGAGCVDVSFRTRAAISGVGGTQEGGITGMPRRQKAGRVSRVRRFTELMAAVCRRVERNR